MSIECKYGEVHSMSDNETIMLNRMLNHMSNLFFAIYVRR